MSHNHLARTKLTGPNLRSFLQGYISCDLDDLIAGTAMPMAITDIKGRVVANGWVSEDSENLILFVHGSVVDTVHQHLLPYMRFARCELSVDSNPFYVSESPADVSPGFTLDRKQFGYTDQAADAYDLDQFQIDTGYALVTEATSGKFLPQMLNLTEFEAVSFTKGCYLGQEVVARAQHRGQVKRRLRLVSHDGVHLAIGDQVQTNNGDKATVVVWCNDSALVVVSTTSSDGDVQLVDEQIA